MISHYNMKVKQFTKTLMINAHSIEENLITPRIIELFRVSDCN